MSTRTLPGGRRRWLTAGALGALLLVTASGCYGTWGVRTSYRNYVAAPFANGGITTEAGATWTDGPGTGKGPFQFEVAYASLDPATETGFIQFAGGVHTKAHPLPSGGYALELSIWNPRLELNGDTGTLLTDLSFRPFEGMGVTTAPPLQGATDVAFATVDLSGFDWTLHDDTYTITDAPMVGAPAAMELIGWDEFYGSTTPELDPISASVNPTVFAPTLTNAPRVTVSTTTGLEAGDTVVVWGRGFDPAQATGTRPPLSGQPSGTYVTYGNFASAWQPSTGAAGSTRPVISQRWALPQSSFTALNPTGTNPAYVLIDQYGNWETTLTLTTAPTTGNLGIYTYPGSGATNAAYELSVPLAVSA